MLVFNRIILSLGLLGSLFVQVPSANAVSRNTLATSVVYKADRADIISNWSVKESSNSVTKISLFDGKGALLQNVNVSTKSKKSGSVLFKDLNPGVFKVVFERSKGSKFRLVKTVTVLGVNRVSSVSVSVTGNVGRVEWEAGSLESFRKVDYYKVKLSQGDWSYSENVPGSSDYLILYFDKLDGYKASESVKFEVVPFNKAGAGEGGIYLKENNVTYAAETGKFLITQNEASEIFGGFALLNRSAVGVVDLNDSVQRSLYPVPYGLNQCIVSKLGVEIIGLSNLGAVLAMRGESSISVLSSGANKLSSDISFSESNLVELDACAQEFLVSQLNVVAGTLLPGSSVVDVQVLKTNFNRADRFVKVVKGVYGNSLPIELYWVVSKDGNQVVSQYMLINSGKVKEGYLEDFLSKLDARNQ